MRNLAQREVPRSPGREFPGERLFFFGFFLRQALQVIGEFVVADPAQQIELDDLEGSLCRFATGS